MLSANKREQIKYLVSNPINGISNQVSSLQEELNTGWKQAAKIKFNYFITWIVKLEVRLNNMNINIPERETAQCTD